MNQEEAEELLGPASTRLSEHFDSIQIMATWDEEGVTKYAFSGNGNWFARQGLAHEFIAKENASITAYETARVNRELEE